MKRKTISLICLLSMILVVFTATSSAWAPITHYHINNQAKSGLEYQEIYVFNGTGPDMSVLIDRPLIGPPPVGKDWDWADFLHSPDPKEEEGKRPYWDSPNFAYLMLKVAGLDTGISSKKEAYGLGWGGHIAADWVAHNDNLFPISPPGSKEEKQHFLGETLYDLYTCNTRGPISPWEYEFPELNKDTANSSDRSVFIAPNGTYTIKITAIDLNNLSVVDTQEIKVRVKSAF